MGEMAATGGMPVPRNSIPMRGGEGPFGAIDMIGMFTVLKVREGITSYEDPGWYQHPPGTVAYEVEGPALPPARAGAARNNAPATAPKVVKPTNRNGGHDRH